MVPPYSGCGCANTRAALGAPVAVRSAGRSRTASRTPAGPFKSVMVGMGKSADDVGKNRRPGQQAHMTGFRHLPVLGSRNERGVDAGRLDWNDPIEIRLAGQDQRR